MMQSLGKVRKSSVMFRRLLTIEIEMVPLGKVVLSIQDVDDKSKDVFEQYEDARIGCGCPLIFSSKCSFIRMPLTFAAKAVHSGVAFIIEGRLPVCQH